RAWLRTRTSQDLAIEPIARATMLETNRQTTAVRSEAKAALLAADPRAKTKDSDYVFITFILAKLPHGLIGLLIAVIFAAALNSFAALAAQVLVVSMFLSLNIGYLWYNLIGCAACIAFSMLLQTVLGSRASTDPSRGA